MFDFGGCGFESTTLFLGGCGFESTSLFWGDVSLSLQLCFVRVVGLSPFFVGGWNFFKILFGLDGFSLIS